jgi:hypothetical protein
MKRTFLSIVLLLSVLPFAMAQTVWSGPTISFTKAPFANPALAANQDRITPTTWITRGNTQGIFNIFSEAGFTHTTSPANTEWATGSLANYASLTYQPWEIWAGGQGNIPAIVGRQAVLHLIAENIYIGISFTAWGVGGGAGGSFSYQRTTALVPTPVKLIEFAATKKNNQLFLSWQTASEENTNFFSIERSSDGKQFTAIGNVKASGNSHSVINYSYTDDAPLSLNFYRLKTVDNDGTFAYSKIIAFKLNKIESLAFFPVPATSNLTIQLNVKAATELQIIDVAGSVRKTKMVAQGANAFSLDITDLHAGLYFLKADDENRLFIKR